MAKAAELLTVEEREARSEKYAGFQQMILEELEKQGIDVQVNGDLENKLPHVLNLRLPGVVNDLLLMKLDLNGIAISTGSACTAGNIEPSHVLEAMYGKRHTNLERIDSDQLWLWQHERRHSKFIQQLVGAIK